MSEQMIISIEATKLAEWINELWVNAVNEPKISPYVNAIDARNDALKRFQTVFAYIAKDIARTCVPDADDRELHVVIEYLAGESDLDSDDENHS